ncbi:MAG: extracellular solute-binding protein, partial [Lachnospiraceae bacterium]|nr:extracellular solute-binding protein [Lachnospiraceae bacterium]
MKKFLAALTVMCMILSLTACGSEPNQSAGTEQNSTPTGVVTGREAIDVIGEDGIDWNHMSMDELYEMAKKEGGTITIYATTADADTARKYIRDKYPDLKFEYISCDTNTVMPKIEMEAQSGTPMADVLMVKDASGEVFNEYVLWDLVKIFYPADVCTHMTDDMLRFGLPTYSTFNPWFYNTRMFDKVPIESWWDIVAGYDEETQS